MNELEDIRRESEQGIHNFMFELRAYFKHAFLGIATGENNKFFAIYWYGGPTDSEVLNCAEVLAVKYQIGKLYTQVLYFSFDKPGVVEKIKREYDEKLSKG